MRKERRRACRFGRLAADSVHEQILKMADMIRSGIMKQFPDKAG